MAEMTLATPTLEGMVHRVAGYDSRDSSTSWSDKRRETYLYRPDVTRPFSADTTVWPSIFAPATSEARSRFGYQDTWANLDELRATTIQTFKNRQLIPFHMIAITLVLGEYSKHDGTNWSSIIPPTKPDHLPDSCSFLGFDVCDAWLLSALMNYGFDPHKDSISALRGTWAPHLNHFHLFNELGPAIAFKQLSDRRLNKDHTPCFVFGLWVVT